MRAARRIRASASRVGASGSSLTAKLAIGGERYAEADPGVLMANPALKFVLEELWDRPQTRSDFIDIWTYTAKEFQRCSSSAAWRMVRGPVSGAWAQLKGLGATWPAPFRIRLLDCDVDLLQAPPRQVMQTVSAHARRHFDMMMICRITAQLRGGEGLDDTLQVYRHGIDWNVVRGALRNHDGCRQALEVRSLELLVIDALWFGERRHQAGLHADGKCEACHIAAGSNQHRLHECDGVVQYLSGLQAEGRIGRPQGRMELPTFALLARLGLPPKRHGWRPVNGRRLHGTLVNGIRGVYYGDGSGAYQEMREHRRSTWALYRGSVDHAVPGHGIGAMERTTVAEIDVHKY